MRLVVRAGVGATTFPSARYRAITVRMWMQETLLAKKRRGPAPTGKGTQIVVRMHPDQLGPLDAWIEAQPEPKPTRPEAIRRIVDATLKNTRSHLNNDTLLDLP